MSNILSTIFITEETFPIHTVVKNALANSLRGFTWYVERTPENEKVLQEALGVDFKRTQYGYYLEHTKGFIPHENGDHIALCVSIADLTLEQLQTLATKPSVFKIHNDETVDRMSDKPHLTHPLLFKSGDGIDRVYIIQTLQQQNDKL
jgi:hypothetical protein